MSEQLTKQEYGQLVDDLESQPESVYRVSYAIRCLDIGDGEKEHLTEDCETISVHYRQPLINAGVIRPDETYLDGLWMPEDDTFLKHIWRADLYRQDFWLWEMVICACDYEFYLEMQE